MQVLDTGWSQIVQLIHLTAREFLLDHATPAKPYNLDEIRGDFEIADTCFRYLRIVFEAQVALVNDPQFSHVKELTDHLSNYPLLPYIFEHFDSHLQNSNSRERLIPIKTEFEAFVRGLGEMESYSSLLLSHWITSLNWIGLPLQTNETSSRICLTQVLTCAAGVGDIELLNLLILLGADPTATLHNQITPLMNAAQFNRSKNVRLLIDWDADVNASNTVSGSALGVAVQAGHLEIAKLLLDYHADVNAKGATGSPMDIAVREGHDDIVKLLREHGAEVET